MSKILKSGFIVTTALSIFLSPFALAARDQISIVGSSTVYPFTTVVAERFGRTTDHPTPKVESTGTGGGMKQFCAGVGTEFPDITNASRRIKESELNDCRSNGVTDVVEIKVGYDGVVMASSYAHDAMQLSLTDLYLALAARVPDASGTKLVRNTHTTWNQVNSSLPNRNIEILGPPPTSGTRDAFLELVMEVGAKRLPLLAKIAAAKDAELVAVLKAAGLEDLAAMAAAGASGTDLFAILTHTLREDGAFIEAGENDNLIVQKLNANGEAVGIFGFSFLDQNIDSVQGHVIDGIAPEFEAIADGSYEVSRPLFIYVKAQHVPVVPGMREFINEFTSERAWGDEGYLTDRGLIPMSADERAIYSSDAAALKPMQL